MGAALTTQNATSNLELRKRIDYIAKNLIFDSDFTNMTKLGNEKYCNMLVKKVSKEFELNKDSIDIVSLRKKLYEIKTKKYNSKKNVTEDEDDDYTRNYDDKSDRVSSKNNDNASSASSSESSSSSAKPQRDTPSEEKEKAGGSRSRTGHTRMSTNTPKKRVTSIHNIKKKCNDIAEFYVLFAHLFACIVSTIDPSFEINASSSSSSSSSNKKNANLLDFCSSRLDSLINNELIENSEGDITIKPKVCKTNLSEEGTVLRLIDLPGMKALLKLFKDGSDADEYQEDVKYLYEKFTGKPPPNHVNIESIPLKTFNKDVECSGSSSERGESSSRSNYRGGARRYMDEFDFDEGYRYPDREEREIRNLDVNVRSGVYSTGVKGNPTKEKLFSDYIKNIKLMIQKSESNRSLLLEILSEMFTYTYDSNDEVTGVIIRPSLTFKDLQSLVKRTRKIIIKLYTECEEDYNTGLDIYFALIQEKMLSKLLIQDEALQDVALRRKLNEFMIPKLERSIIVNPYENPYQNQNLRNNIFIPPQFRTIVMQELKKIFKQNNDVFQVAKEDIDSWMDEEIRNATDTLDPYQVAKEFYDFYQQNVYREEEKTEDDNSSKVLRDRGAPAPSSATAPAPPAPATFTPVTPAPATFTPVTSATFTPVTSAPATSARPTLLSPKMKTPNKSSVSSYSPPSPRPLFNDDN